MISDETVFKIPKIFSLKISFEMIQSFKMVVGKY